jgi:DNA-binding phage protein
MKKNIMKKDDIGVDFDMQDKLFSEIKYNKGAMETYYVEKAMINFVEDLKEEMGRKHMSYYSVAKKAGINHQALARILNGAKNAEISTLAKVCRGLGGQLSLSIVKK